MFSKLLITAFLTLGMTIIAHSEVLVKELGANEIAGVKLAKTASTKINNTNVHLTQVAAGLRQKKVLVANVKVYVAELYVSEPQKLNKSADHILHSLATMNTVAMQLTFMRNVEADKVQISFRDALVANGINLEEPAIKQLLEYVIKGGEAKEGKTLTFLINKNSDNTETLYYAANDDVVNSVTGLDLIKKVFSMWLGEPADDGLKRLKEEMLK